VWIFASILLTLFYTWGIIIWIAMVGIPTKYDSPPNLKVDAHCNLQVTQTTTKKKTPSYHLPVGRLMGVDNLCNYVVHLEEALQITM
jgi:hypothetical protein